MSLQPISHDAVHLLLGRQTAGIFPPEIADAEWYGTSANGILGAILTNPDSTWRFAMLTLGRDGNYQRVASGDGYESSMAARAALRAAHLDFAKPQ